MEIAAVRPCKKHGENIKRVPSGACRTCLLEAKARYKAKIGPEEWARRRRLYDKASYDKPDSKTSVYRKRFRHNRKVSDPVGYMLADVRSGARKRGYEFTLTRGDISIPEKCPVFGLRLEYVSGRRTPNTPSLDRIDSSKGYVPGNIIVVSWRVNEIKMSSTPEDLVAVGVFYQNLMEKRDKDALERLPRIADFRSD
jgi:hypothetical protein